MKLQRDSFESPLGTILLVHDENGSVRALDFVEYEARMTRLLRLHYGVFQLNPGRAPLRTTDALGRYFAGELDAPMSLRVETGGTAFQRRVWSALRDIPIGETRTYGALASSIGSPKAVRAVGLANGANPVGIVVPCHRVIGAKGALTGFAGGLQRKQWLLDHEGARYLKN